MQGAPLLEPAQPEPREPGGNAAPPEQPELRSNCNTRRTKFQKLLAEQVRTVIQHTEGGAADAESTARCRLACAVPSSKLTVMLALQASETKHQH